MSIYEDKTKHTFHLFNTDLENFYNEVRTTNYETGKIYQIWVTGTRGLSTGPIGNGIDLTFYVVDIDY